MPPSLISFWHTLFLLILLLGAVQGGVMGWLLLRGSSADTQRLANKILAVLLFFSAYRLGVVFLKVQGLAGVDHWSYHLLIELNWVYGPLLYLYAMAFARPGFTLGRGHAIHFLPALVEFACSNFVKSQNFYWDGTRESLSWAGYYGYILWMHTPFPYLIAMGLILGYSVYALGRMKAFRQKAPFALTPAADLRLSRILWGYAGFAACFTLASLADYLFFDYAFDPWFEYPGFTVMALLTYWLGLQGVLHRQDIQFEKLPPPGDVDPRLQELAARLEQLMKTEKPYLQPELGVADLASQLEVKPFMVSRALNTVLQQSFPEYVNTYRVKELQARLRDPRFAHYSLLALAFDSGFNSKASFNRVVKKVTGKAPSELREL